MKKWIYKYEYIIRPLYDKETCQSGFEAYIPAFNGLVFGDTVKEIEDGVEFSIETEIDDLKKEGKEIPLPDKNIDYSGQFTLRINPELHRRLSICAKSKKQSLNSYIERKLALNH